MNEWTGCFDPDSMVEGLDDGVSQVLKPSTLMVGSHNSSAENLKLSTEELSYQYSNTRREEPASAAMELQLQNQRMAFNTHLMKDSSDQAVAFPSSSFPNSFSSVMNPTHTTPLSDLQRTDTLDALHRRFDTEVERRREMQDKYQTLRNLIPNPNPTKYDRASVIGDAVEYVKELLQTVNELKILVEKKRRAREMSKGHNEEDSIENKGHKHESSSVMEPLGDPDDQSNNGSLRNSWIQRKSKDTGVDVTIVGDEVTIKLVQRKNLNCLLSVSKVLDELQLDLYHVAGGHNNDHYSFLFKTKIYEGSSVEASALADKLIEMPLDPLPFSNSIQLSEVPVKVNIDKCQIPGTVLDSNQGGLKVVDVIDDGKPGWNMKEKGLLFSVLKLIVVFALVLSTTTTAVGIIMSAFLLIFIDYVGKRLVCLLKPWFLAFPPILRACSLFGGVRRYSKKRWINAEEYQTVSDPCELIGCLEFNSPV